ncbi:hypothetical protein [Arthrobacter crystallopoietes]|uniref:Uncharacterized protein n=1 Tax=Crystallibacter crystallopoietes TaxID=37928 RepID=A0A1H0XJY1_9MICC|nr:hypothetical protein SAMN04489742_0024 [Arthrobacter crystallopoietes]
MRLSKADGSQTTDVQRDALLASVIGGDALYENLASGQKDDRPQLAACTKTSEQILDSRKGLLQRTTGAVPDTRFTMCRN